MNYVQLEQIVSIVGGGTPSREVAEYWNGNIPWVSVKDFKSREISNAQEYITELGLNKSASNLIESNSILTPTRMGLGKVAINTVPVAINQDVKALKIKDSNAVNLRYLAFFLESKSSHIESLGKGATVKGITLDVLKKLEIPLPPITEQKRIADILAKADSMRTKRREAITLINSLTQSIFLEMFGNTENITKKWPTKKLGELLSFLTSGSRGWAEYYAESGDMFLRIQNVGRGELLLDDCTFVNAPDTAEAQRTKVQGGDILLSITADLGRTAVVPENFGTAFINQHLAILRVQGINPYFLSSFFTSPAGQIQVLGRNKGGVKAGLNFDDIRSFAIPIPPEEIQKEFLTRARKVALLKTRLTNADAQAKELFLSIQKQAFTGNL